MKPSVFLSIVVLATGCVHRTVQRTSPSPDAALRSIFQQQTQGAFNPLSDDRRFAALQVRLKLNPQDLAARLELAGVYENYRLYDDGLEQYRTSLGLARSAPGDNASFAEKAVLGLRRCAQASGRTREAIPLIEEFLNESPSAILWNELGLLHDALGNLASGETAFQEAVARDARSDLFHNNFGYNLMLQNKTGAAEAEFRRALALNPKSATTRNNLGVLLARRGDLQGALEQFQFTADAATAHNNLAVVLLELGQYEQSREELVKALALRHYFAPALANFKLVQERIRDRADLQKPGGVPPSKPPAAVVQSKDPEDR